MRHQGVLDFLLGTDPIAEALLSSFVFKALLS
jgi:hypothetical protein